LGVIQKQSIKGSIFSYLGVLLGFINTVVISPIIFSAAEIGLFNIMVAYTVLFAQFGSLGFVNVTTRLFPYFRNKETQHNGYVFIATLVAFVGFILSLAGFLWLKPVIIENNIEKSPILVNYISYLIPLIFFTIIFNILDAYNKLLYNAVIGIFLKEVLFRILNFLFIVLYAFELLSFNGFIVGYVTSLCMPAVIISISLLFQKELSFKPNLKFVDKKLARSMLSVGIYGVIAGLSTNATVTLDKIMVNTFTDLNSVGIYSITFFFGTLIIIPSRTLRKISSTIIAEAWKCKDYKLINDVYYKSTINQLIVGMILFISIWINVDNILWYLPPAYSAGKYVILFIGISNLIDMATGVSSSIISSSDYYKVTTYTTIGLVVVLVLCNYIFITLYGLTGAAVATMVAILTISLIRYVFLFVKFKFQPYCNKHLKTILLGIALIIANSFLPTCPNVLIDFIYRSTIIVGVLVTLIYLMQISVEINEKIDFVLLRVFKTLRKND
jgi:O-antigen/teichoic acid export membrane protein